MRSFSDLIAATKTKEGEGGNPVAAVVFVAVLIASATGVAYWIGGAIDRPNVSSPAMETATADFSF